MASLSYSKLAGDHATCEICSTSDVFTLGPSGHDDPLPSTTMCADVSTTGPQGPDDVLPSTTLPEVTTMLDLLEMNKLGKRERYKLAYHVHHLYHHNRNALIASLVSTLGPDECLDMLPLSSIAVADESTLGPSARVPLPSTTVAALGASTLRHQSANLPSNAVVDAVAVVVVVVAAFVVVVVVV